MNRTMLFLFAFALIGISGLLAQTIQPDTLSPLVGPTIDRTEYQYYRLDKAAALSSFEGGFF